jgi:hypothetical protein
MQGILYALILAGGVTVVVAAPAWIPVLLAYGLAIVTNGVGKVAKKVKSN